MIFKTVLHLVAFKVTFLHSLYSSSHESFNNNNKRKNTYNQTPEAYNQIHFSHLLVPPSYLCRYDTPVPFFRTSQPMRNHIGDYRSKCNIDEILISNFSKPSQISTKINTLCCYYILTAREHHTQAPPHKTDNNDND